MAVSNHKVDAATGLVSNPAQVHGGTYIDGGTASASPAISNRLSLGLQRDLSGTGQTENVNAEKARSGGTWDYQAAGSYVVRRMATTINGTADTTLHSGASNFGRRSIHVRSNQIGAHLGKATRNGLWRPTGISGQRSNWAAGSGTESGMAYSVATRDGIAGVVSTANANYAANTGSLSATADDAARPTRAVPGELVYLQNHVLWSSNLIDYAARE